MKASKLLMMAMALLLLTSLLAGCDLDSGATILLPDMDDYISSNQDNYISADKNTNIYDDEKTDISDGADGSNADIVPSDKNTASDETAEYQGIVANKLPYETKGIKVTSISIDESFVGAKVTIKVKNNTGYAISSLTNIPYKCYDAGGTVLKSGMVFFTDLNNGETAEVYFYAESGTGKILFGEADVDKGKALGNNDTEIYDGIEVTKLPYETKGIKVTSISIDESFVGAKVTIKVKNNTGYAISSLTNIPYKCYDAGGTVLKSGMVFLTDLNNGETAEVYFYAESGTGKILFGEADISR